MMMVTSLFGGLTGAGAAAGAATAGVAATSGMSILSGIGTAFSALASIAQGSAAASAAKAQAKQEELQASAAYTSGVEAQAKLKKQLALTLDRQAVTFAASGVDLSSGSVERAKTMAVADAEHELEVSSNSALRQGQAHLAQARVYRQQARNAMMGGIFNAVGGMIG
jgi:hypothetical protein